MEAPQRLEYTVRFITPAFLGDADQRGAWRTPPFKALIRQWWRVVKASELIEKEMDEARVLEQLRGAEGKLFGTASDTESSESRRSDVVIRLENSKQGTLIAWRGDREKRVWHPEAGNGGMKVSAELYLGYGPLKYSSGATGLKDGATAIGPKETEKITIIFPRSNEAEMRRTVDLINWFGTIGGRSRNGWGSLVLNKDSERFLDPNQFPHAEFRYCLRPWQDCLKLDWPHAIGSDAGRPCIWRTKTFGSWHDIMEELARIKIAFRTSLSIKNSTKHNVRPDQRHVLALPVTNHPVEGLERLANQLRFKVLQDASAGYTGLAFHIPCSVPKGLKDPNRILDQQAQIWQKVHDTLTGEMTRL